ITKVSSVLVTERGQLHPYQRLQTHHAKERRLFRFGNVGRREYAFGSHFLPSEHHMDCISRLGLRPVEKKLDPLYMAANQARLCERSSGRIQVAPAEENIDVASIPHCSLIDRRNP